MQKGQTFFVTIVANLGWRLTNNVLPEDILIPIAFVPIPMKLQCIVSLILQREKTSHLLALPFKN